MAPMGIHGMLLRLVLIGLLILATTVAATTVEAKPGCPDRCGNLSIPYPFGTKAGCYYKGSFLITCNHSFKPPKAFLQGSNIEVTRISPDGQLYVLIFRACDCYDVYGRAAAHNGASLTLGRFTISDTLNKFVAVGCDTNAILKGYQIDGTKYTTGCMSICNNLDYVNDSCSGTGCCQVSIPKRFRNFTITLSSYCNHKYAWAFNPCSYAFVVQEREFHFSRNYLTELRHQEKLPMVLDWAVGNGNETCQVARKNETSYACKGNSTCHQNDNGSGYRCRCLDGYEGNPYLNGCQDIDECKDLSINKCEKSEYCVNEIGNFTCSCPKGYHGDGRKNGKGCIANQLHVIQVALGIITSLLLLLLGSSWLHWGLRKRKLIKLKEKFFKQNGGLMLQQQLSRHEGSVEIAKIFTSEDLKKATKNYHESRILGQGGQGTVYKGILSDNRTVAIKKSKLGDQTQVEQFINEVIVLSQVIHRNVVKLLGCCLETQVPLLVYEFVTNGTLFDHIHNVGHASSIPWETRLKIATETAGALLYLHFATSIPIIHRDVKTTNILLDENYTAEVSDFGASRLMPLDRAQLTTLVQGTLGYLDPEYFHTSQLTEKSDVYSFEVVLVELLTGKMALSFERPEEERNLATYFISLVNEDCLVEVLDNRVLNEGNPEQLRKVAMLAMRCLKVKGEERPTMKEVAMELEGLRSMEKQGEINSGETEGLPVELSDTNGAGTSSNTTGYDSIRSQVILAFDDGR